MAQWPAGEPTAAERPTPTLLRVGVAGVLLWLGITLICWLPGAAAAASGPLRFATEDGRRNGDPQGMDLRVDTAPLTGGGQGGYVAPPLGLPTARSGAASHALRQAPSRHISRAAFDLRLSGPLPAVRDQGRYGTCWAFAALASLESCAADVARLDLSENNLVNRAGFRPRFGQGGNSRMATACLARWDGPVLERDDRYARPGASPDGLPARLRVREVLFLPPRQGAADNATIKWALLTYGAVDCSMYWDDYCYRPGRASYYYDGIGLNHDVTCVGWDDRYPASAFVERPPADGAFLVRNSWGRGFGDGGYFWVSYHDTAFAGDAAVFAEAERPGPYSTVYGHDELGWIDSAGFDGAPGYAWFAARHVAEAGGSLAAVSFYTPVAGARYEVYAGPSLDHLSSSPLAEGSLEMPGFHTVDLCERLAVQSGRPFFVAVMLRTPGFLRPVAVERSWPGYSAAATSAGQSYVSADGRQWLDLGRQRPAADVCLKAYTVDEEPPATPPTVVVDSLRIRSGRGPRITFHVAHATPRTTARVTLRLVTRTGRTVRRATLRAVPTGARRIWRPARRLPAGRYRVIARAVDAQGDRQLGAVRTVVRVTSRVR
jgi:C1A family cysteine protease